MLSLAVQKMLGGSSTAFEIVRSADACCSELASDDLDRQATEYSMMLTAWK